MQEAALHQSFTCDQCLLALFLNPMKCRENGTEGLDIIERKVRGRQDCGADSADGNDKINIEKKTGRTKWDLDE